VYSYHTILMHSRDIKNLIFHCDLLLCTTPACFSTFSIYYGHLNFYSLMYLPTFLEILWLEPMPHATVNDTACLSYRLKTEVSVMLCFQPCFNSLHSSIQIISCLITTMKNSIVKGSHHMLPSNQHFLLSARINGGQRRCVFCSMPKNSLFLPN